MDAANTKPKPSWTSAYTGIAFAMVACIWLPILPSILERPDLLFLKPVGQLLFIVLLATFTILLRLDAGKLTRGLLLLILPVYMIFGAAIGIQLYEAFAR